MPDEAMTALAARAAATGASPSRRRRAPARQSRHRLFQVLPAPGRVAELVGRLLERLGDVALAAAVQAGEVAGHHPAVRVDGQADRRHIVLLPGAVAELNRSGRVAPRYRPASPA